MREIIIEMDEMGFSANPRQLLITKGITTCIAFAVRGYYLDDTANQKVPLCGLYHWSGFPVNCILTEKYLTQELANFFSTMHKFFQTESIITLTNLYFIGGEKAQYDQYGITQLTGTEREIRVLTKVALTFNYLDSGIRLGKFACRNLHYQTSGEESLEIHVSINELVCYRLCNKYSKNESDLFCISDKNNNEYSYKINNSY